MFDELRARFLSDQVNAALEEVNDHFHNEAADLRKSITSGDMTRQEAIDHLTSNHQLTQRGAEDILDNY